VHQLSAPVRWRWRQWPCKSRQVIWVALGSCHVKVQGTISKRQCVNGGVRKNRRATMTITVGDGVDNDHNGRTTNKEHWSRDDTLWE